MLRLERERHIAIIQWYSNDTTRLVGRGPVIGVPKLRLEGEGRLQGRARDVLHGSLSTYCRILLLLAPSRALAAPSRGDST